MYRNRLLLKYLLGTVDQFLFDDESWTIRYLVVETGKLLGKKVLISPISIDRKHPSDGLALSLTKEQIRNSPGIDTDKPVSRQHETQYFNYYGYPYYWGGPGLWGGTAYPIGHPSTTGGLGYPDRTSGHAGTAATTRRQAPKEEGDPHLRSTKEVIGYYIEASDGNIGHVEDFIIDNENWAIRYMVVDTVNWWPGKKVVVAPQWIKDVSWMESRVYVNLSRDRIKSAPEYDPAAIIGRDYEDKLYEHYGSPKEPPYWHHPVRQIYGAALLQAAKAEDAEKVYREDLKRHPENGWSLYGLLASLRAQGKTEEANAVAKRFRDVWRLADITLTASRF